MGEAHSASTSSDDSKRNLGSNRNPGCQRLALAIVFMIVMGVTFAQTPLDHLRFAVDESTVQTEYRLGMNRFSAAQLVYFLASIERFLVLADGLPDGERVTLRQDGREGYIALTAYDTEHEPFYVLTFAAEEPTGIVSRLGLEALWVVLAEQLPQAFGVPSAEIAIAAP